MKDTQIVEGVSLPRLTEGEQGVSLFDQIEKNASPALRRRLARRQAMIEKNREESRGRTDLHEHVIERRQD